MDDNIYEARIGVIDTLRGVLLHLAEADSLNEQERADIIEQMGDLAEMLLDVLRFEIVSVEGDKITATLELEPL